jgi:hypothetical protein
MARARGRPASGFERLTERASFLATIQQLEWLDDARKKAGESSLSAWIRRLAVDEGERLLGKPYPKPKQLTPARRKK